MSDGDIVAEDLEADVLQGIGLSFRIVHSWLAVLHEEGDSLLQRMLGSQDTGAGLRSASGSSGHTRTARSLDESAPQLCQALDMCLVALVPQDLFLQVWV